jgi:hypothetical protein
MTQENVTLRYNIKVSIKMLLGIPCKLYSFQILLTISIIH